MKTSDVMEYSYKENFDSRDCAFLVKEQNQYQVTHENKTQQAFLPL